MHQITIVPVMLASPSVFLRFLNLTVVVHFTRILEVTVIMILCGKNSNELNYVFF